MKVHKPREISPKRVSVPRVRKNAVSSYQRSVIPQNGIDELRRRIGDPFEPLDFRQLIEQASQQNPTDVDQQFEHIVQEITTRQLNELLSAMRIKRDDPIDFQKAFETLAMALLRVGQVVWRPPAAQQRGWTLDNYATLYSLVEGLKEWQGLSERAAIEKIASDPQVRSWFPYRPQQRTQISARSGRMDALWQALMRAKHRKSEIRSLLRSRKPLEDVFGRTLGRWEARLVELDIKHLAPTIGKKCSR